MIEMNLVMLVACLVGGNAASLPTNGTSSTNLLRLISNKTDNSADRKSKQIDRTDALLGGFNAADATELPLHEPTGEKTRKTYDFTSKCGVHL